MFAVTHYVWKSFQKVSYCFTLIVYQQEIDAWCIQETLYLEVFDLFSKWVSMLCANIFLAFKFKNVDSDVFALASHQIQILLECKSSYYLLPSDTLSCTNCKIFALFKTTSAKECQNHGIWCVLKKYLFCNSKQKTLMSIVIKS